MKHLTKILMGLAFLGLAACSSDKNNYYGGEFQSCVDFGGGCDYRIFEEFQNPSMVRYPTDSQGRIEGASQQQTAGVTYYNNLDACSRINSEYLQAQGDNGYYENINRYIVAELPRDGGLVCIDSLALDTADQDPYYNWYGIDTSAMYFSEFAQYGYYPRNNFNTGNQNTSSVNESRNIVTKFITLTGTNGTTTTTTNGTNYINNIRSFADVKDRARSMNVPILCNLRRGSNTVNDDCRGYTCKPLPNNYLAPSGPNTGICSFTN